MSYKNDYRERPLKTLCNVHTCIKFSNSDFLVDITFPGGSMSQKFDSGTGYFFYVK